MAVHDAKRQKVAHEAKLILGEDDAAQHIDAQDNDTYEQDELAAAAHQPDSIVKSQAGSISKRPQHDSDLALYAADSYKSSIFKLQVDEMLAQLRTNNKKRLDSIDKTLQALKESIESIADKQALSISEAEKCLYKSHKIKIPFPVPKPDTKENYKLSYSRPSRINVVGSYAPKTMIKEDRILAVDMVVTMPASIFQEKDFLNYRYFYKRAYYLACLAAGLVRSTGIASDLEFDYLNGNSLHPILVVTRHGDSSMHGLHAFKYCINVIPAAPDGLFAEAKLKPDRNSVRSSIIGGLAITTTQSPTPFYNASLRADCNYSQYLKLHHRASKQAVGFLDACILGRTWLHQRGLGSSLGKGGFGNFEWTTLTALLLQTGGAKGRALLSSGYSSYQLFKGVLQHLADQDLVRKPICLRAENVNFDKHIGPMLYDGSRGQNILYKMTLWSCTRLQEEAKISLEMLNDATYESFDATFIHRKDRPMYVYDSIFQIPTSRHPKSTLLDHLDGKTRLYKKLYTVLKEGLNDRIKDVQIIGSDNASWPLSAEYEPSTAPVTVGIIFDPANINRLVDHGPSAAETTKASRFQQLWGDRAELRRFKDGTILESVVWVEQDGVPIYQDITKYLVKRHLGHHPSFLGAATSDIIAGIEFENKSFDRLRTAYIEFENNFRSLSGLPLELKLLSATDAQLRGSSVHEPFYSTTQHLQHPAEVILQFEGSGRWPDDVVAIQRTKISFLLKIAELMQFAVDDIAARLGVENSGQDLLNCAFLDLSYPSGAVFRLRIHADREQALLGRQIKEKAIEPRLRQEAVLALSSFKRNCAHLPLHTQSLAIQCTRFPLLSPTMRLLKKWFNVHLLGNHISTEVIELLATRTFLHPYPWRAPTSVTTGFLRTIQFISRWDWRRTPLVTDFSGTMTSQDISTINTTLEAWRRVDPAMNRIVLFAASNHDTAGTAFTDGMPSKVAASRMSALARTACSIVKDHEVKLDMQLLFQPSPKDYDFVIHISPNFSKMRRGRKSLQASHFKNLELQNDEGSPAAGYEPVTLFVQELESLYTTSIVFFHDPDISSFIGGLWNPQADSRSFRVNMSYNTEPTASRSADPSERGDVTINKAAILSEIARLGGDMVVRTEANR